MSGIELCVGAVVVRNASILLIRRGQPPGEGLWSVPGGRVQRGEGLATATLRELKEEAGLSGQIGEFIGWTEHIGRRRHYVIMDFFVSVADDALAVAGSDASDVAWVELDQLAAWDLVDGLVEFLAENGIITV